MVSKFLELNFFRSTCSEMFAQIHCVFNTEAACHRCALQKLPLKIL